MGSVGGRWMRARAWERRRAQLGVSRATLDRWLGEEPSGDSSPVREVVVREEEAGAGAGLTLVTPKGFRIEGLAVADLSALVRSLRR